MKESVGEPIDLAYYRRLATWMQVPRLPGQERAFEAWCNADASHPEIWAAWESIRTQSATAFGVLPDAEFAWEALRQRLGFVRVGRTKKRRHKAAQRRTKWQLRDALPLLVALLVSFLVALLFLVLYLMRG